MRKYSVKYSDDLYNLLVSSANDYTIKELTQIIKNKFGVVLKNKQLAQYCIKMGIRYKYEKPNKAHSNKPTPNGTVVNKTDGNMLKIKTGDHKWEYLQRVIYEKKHNIKLNDDEYIIFLDQNKRNFNINNLKLVSKQESAMLSKKLTSKIPQLTETSILAIKMINKAKKLQKTN